MMHDKLKITWHLPAPPSGGTWNMERGTLNIRSLALSEYSARRDSSDNMKVSK